MVNVLWQAHHNDWHIAPTILLNGKSSTTILFLFLSFSIWCREKKGYIVTHQSNNGGIRRFLSWDGRVYFHSKNPAYLYMEEEKPNCYPIKFSIPQKSIHIQRFSVNRIGRIPTITATWSQSSWCQDSKRCQLQVLRILIDWHASCPPPAWSPNTFRRFAFMIQILSSSQTSRKSQGIKRFPTNSVLPTPFSQAPTGKWRTSVVDMGWESGIRILWWDFVGLGKNGDFRG